ncbi:hypothetical protein AXF42_Ash018505 [Apostasia shenzhenica]|uniref:EamA domain-containing protein n=1 Tax=Apostasia shenzhenica TaxID=1088818 RepID=A0A2H9ZZH3_9ASPA|nr:hypothetical protein AXF42_Ash018505 [Apostasia shenzhenica]
MGDQSLWVVKGIRNDSWRWALGIGYIIAVAAIWIAASYIVQSVVDAGISPFLLSYICNSLFVVYIPIVEIARYFEDSVSNLLEKKDNKPYIQEAGSLENAKLLQGSEYNEQPNITVVGHHKEDIAFGIEAAVPETGRISPGQVSSYSQGSTSGTVDSSKQLDSKGRWARARIAEVSLLICPFWFFAQLTFNLSLKYTTVTSNTILSSTSSLFTFLVSVAFLGEKFTWIKLVSVLLCMGGTLIVSLADSGVGENAIATNYVLGDALALFSAAIYAVYITLIRKKLPDEKKGEGRASTAQFLGYLGLFNLLIFLPVALFLNFTKLEPFPKLTWSQFGLIVGKGLLDNVLSDYLWAKAILLTSTTVATAGLTIQVPIAAIVDSITGHAPHLLDYIGAAIVMLGFAGINIPSEENQAATKEQEIETEHNIEADHNYTPSVHAGATDLL